MAKNKKAVVQNQRPDFEDIQPVIDDHIVDTVHDLFLAIVKLNDVDDIFDDLTNQLANDLRANSLLEYNLELTDDQKGHLCDVIKIKGNEVVRNYLANLNTDHRTKLIYGLVREKTTAIADYLLSSIGKEINRGAVINAQAVQANSKNDKYDEILLRKSKSSGDITVPTSVILLSSNCVELFKSSCQEAKGGKASEAATGDGSEKKTKKAGGK